MANVDEEVGSSASSSSSSATTTPVATQLVADFRTAGPQQDSGPRTVCGGIGVGAGAGNDQQHGKGLALVRLLKEELKERECASLPPMVYDGKSDLCTLGSRPGMECVPLRSPADPYHYHHVTDQTKSLQELQNEVGALLEFRDLVIETFPDLKTKMASASAANSTLTGIPSSSLASSRREWEPGIRTRRKLTQKDHLSSSHSHQVVSVASTTTSGVVVTSTTGDIHPHHHHHQHHHQQHNSSSLISRSRSNSQSGGSSGGGGGSSSGHHRKEPKSGDAQSSGSVVIQDSGFSTETSSSKETHSASSSTGNGGLGLLQGTINVSNTTSSSSANHQQQRLGVDTEDELWNLLDVIHRKSNRLREEVDALQQLEREKCRSSQNQNVVQNVVNAATSSSSSSSSNSSNNNHHHIHSSSTSSSSGNLPPHHHHHHHVTPSTTASGGLAKTFQNQLLVDVVNKDDVQILRKERDRLFEQLSDYEAEAMASRIRASKMQDEVDVLAAAKRDLESQLQAALSQKLELNTKIHDLHQQFVNKSAPSSPDSIKSRHHHALTPSSGVGLLRKHSSTDSTTTTLHLSTSTTSPSATSSPSSNSQQHLLKPTASRSGSSFAPIVKSVPKSAAAETTVDHPTATSPDALGKLDGLLSSPARVNKVRMTDSKKIAAILLETNIVELQRHLLTITVQNQVLQQRLEYATRSRIFMSKKLDKSKEDIDDLKFRLEEKNIELEGTKAQLRVLESKQQQQQQQQQSGKSSVASSGFSPEHHATVTAVTPTTPSTPIAPVKPSVVSTSAGGIVTSHLSSPVHQPYHQRDLTLRLQQSQVSTPSMKAMIPLAMDEILHHSSSTESAQDQAERLAYPETPKRKPSKIPLPGTKGYVAPKPPTGRNFVANAAASSGNRQDKSSPSPSGSLSNKSLNKSTGSLYMRSTGPSSITSGNRVPRDTSINRPESAQSWTRRDTSLEKSRSSSIPVSSKGSPVAKPPPSASTIVSSSPQPKAKRDSLTTRVKNLDSLSRLQTASASTGNLSKSSSKKDLSSTSFTTGQLGRPERKQGSGGGIRRVSSASIGRSSSTEHSGSSNGSSSVASPTDASGGVNSDNGKARRTNTFRLAKPTLMPPLEIPSSTAAAPPRCVGPYQTPRRSHLPVVVVPPRKPTSAAAASTLIIMASSPDATARQHGSASSSSGSSSSSGGSSPSSVTTVTTIESHSSSTQAPPASRDLIGEYLAAKSRSQGPPAILIPQQVTAVAPSRGDADDLELAYRHPILLMNDEDEQNVFCSVVSSVGNERNREVEVRYVDDNSIELLDAREDFGEGEKESLIVPKPVKKMAFHSLKGSPERKNGGVDEDLPSKCRLVGKVNPNILKTWEQLSGGDKNDERRDGTRRKSSLITVTSSENSADSKQSCLIFYRNQYNNLAAPGEEEEQFHVNRIQHGSVTTSSSSTIEDKATAPRTTSVSMVTSTTTTETTTSSEGCYDFYDSIDDSSTRIDGGGGGGGDLGLEEDEDDEYAMAAGEGLADFTSLDRKKMMWSIDVEQ